MKTREFNISTDGLELDYQIEISRESVEEYLQEDLEVPTEFIESFKITNTYLNIKLSQSREYFNDDWYVNLQRVS